MGALGGARVAILDGRRKLEMAGLVRRHGGEPYSVPAVREAPLDCRDQVAAFIADLARSAFGSAVPSLAPLVVFSTGPGATALFAEAERLGRLPETLAALGRATIVCRGPKPASVLRRHGIPIAVTAREPFTTPEVLAAMAPLDLAGQRAALIHYGERNVALADALRARCGRLDELCLYEWLLPDDVEPLRALVGELCAGRVDAITFTSQVQARHLFRIAADLGRECELVEALNGRTIVASVAPTCEAALRNLGVTPHVVPEHPKMGHLVATLARYLGREGRRSETLAAVGGEVR